MKLLGFLIVIPVFLTAFRTGEDWTLKTSREGASVYVRDVPHSTIPEVKVLFRVRAGARQVLDLISDHERYPEWVYRCSISKTIGTLADQSVLHYQRMDAPWPVTDRDLVIQTRVIERGATIRILSSAAPDMAPASSDAVRVRVFRAEWTLAEEGGSTLVEYILHTHPGGNIPDWVINLALAEGPLQTSIDLAKRAEGRR